MWCTMKNFKLWLFSFQTASFKIWIQKALLLMLYELLLLSSPSHLFPPPSPIFAGGANDRWVRSVSFCPDGQHIASVTDDR